MASQKDTFSVRKAKKEDCKEILRLIQELADYEKMPNGPRIGAETLEEDGFGSSRAFFECFVAEAKSKPNELIGYVLYFYTYSTWEGRSVYMEDIYVTPSCRGLGIGTKLWQSVVKVR